MKKKNKYKLSMWISLFVGVSFAYFVWLSWQKLTDWVGNSTIVWIITGGIVLTAILLGKFSFDKVVEKFT